MGEHEEQEDSAESSSPKPARALSHPMRRHVAELILEADGYEQPMGVVVEDAARFKVNGEASELEGASLKAVRRELVETHLPTLERVGLVTFDRDDDRVALAEAPETVRRLVEDASFDGQ